MCPRWLRPERPCERTPDFPESRHLESRPTKQARCTASIAARDRPRTDCASMWSLCHRPRQVFSNSVERVFDCNGTWLVRQCQYRCSETESTYECPYTNPPTRCIDPDAASSTQRSPRSRTDPHSGLDYRTASPAPCCRRTVRAEADNVRAETSTKILKEIRAICDNCLTMGLAAKSVSATVHSATRTRTVPSAGGKMFDPRLYLTGALGRLDRSTARAGLLASIPRPPPGLIPTRVRSAPGPPGCRRSR